jgi:hypothetical protein
MFEVHGAGLGAVGVVALIIRLFRSEITKNTNLREAIASLKSPFHKQYRLKEFTPCD